MERNGSGVSALLGLDGFVVLAQLLDEDTGEWWLAVETTEDRAWCPTCGVRAVGNGRRNVTVRDLPIAGMATVIVGRSGRGAVARSSASRARGRRPRARSGCEPRSRSRRAGRSAVASVKSSIARRRWPVSSGSVGPVHIRR